MTKLFPNQWHRWDLSILSCCKYPRKEELQTQWNYNKEALLSFLEVVQTGVRGIVTDERGEPVPNANIEISGISGKNITTSYFGEYWRLLAPGNYWWGQTRTFKDLDYLSLCFSIRATSPDESLLTEWKTVSTSALDSKQHTRLDFQLSSREQSSGQTDCQLNSGQTEGAGEGEGGNSGARSVMRNNPLLVFQLLSLIYHICRTWVNNISIYVLFVIFCFFLLPMTASKIHVKSIMLIDY